jgi:hypothetical protein
MGKRSAKKAPPKKKRAAVATVFNCAMKFYFLKKKIQRNFEKKNHSLCAFRPLLQSQGRN